MVINISGRHFEVSAALKQCVEDHVHAVCDGKSVVVTTANIVLDVEQNRCKTDVQMHFKNHEVTASSAGFDMYKTIDEAFANIEKQIVKFLDKVQDHKATPLRDVITTEE